MVEQGDDALQVRSAFRLIVRDAGEGELVERLEDDRVAGAQAVHGCQAPCDVSGQILGDLIDGRRNFKLGMDTSKHQRTQGGRTVRLLTERLGRRRQVIPRGGRIV